MSCDDKIVDFCEEFGVVKIFEIIWDFLFDFYYLDVLFREVIVKWYFKIVEEF